MPVYANGVEVVFSQWDFTFTLSHLFGSGTQDGEPAVGKHAVARVVMSPQHAKAFLLVLGRHIGAYEERFGAIPDLMQEQEGHAGEDQP